MLSGRGKFFLGALSAFIICWSASYPQALAAADKKDKKEEKKPEPPRLIVSMPLAVAPGVTNKIRIRGNNLTEVSELRFTNLAVKATVAIKSKTKVEVPKDADPKKSGDSQLEVELSFPPDTARGTNWFVVVSTNGVSAAHPIIVLPTAELAEEKEPNGGFKQAQAIDWDKTVMGTIKEAADVDVFRFDAVAKQEVRIEVTAGRLGSALDSLLTLYDAGGHILFTNDDAGGDSDSLLVVKLPVAGSYYLSVIDAQDRGGPTFVYLLKLTKK